MASDFAKLRCAVAELRRQTDACVAALHTIRARTSKVLAATDAFSALSREVEQLGRALSAPPTALRLKRSAIERALFQQDVHLLLDQLDGFRSRYAAELLLTTPLPPKPKKPWWRLFG